MRLPGTNPAANPLTFRIVSQPAHGSVAISGNLATFIPGPGFVGSDSFTFAAWNTWVDSNLATGTVTVAQGPFSIGAVAHVPPNYPAAWPVAFVVVPTVSNNTAPVTFNWDFGDGSAHSTNQYAAHAYALARSYDWSVTATVSNVYATASGAITIGNPVQLGIARAGSQVTLSWPNIIADTLLEGTGLLGPSAQWLWITNTPAAGPSSLNLTLPASGNEFFRVRRPW